MAFRQMHDKPLSGTTIHHFLIQRAFVCSLMNTSACQLIFVAKSIIISSKTSKETFLDKCLPIIRLLLPGAKCYVLHRFPTKLSRTNEYIRHYIPTLINDLPKELKAKIDTHSLSGFTNSYKRKLLSNYPTECLVRDCYVCGRAWY